MRVRQRRWEEIGVVGFGATTVAFADADAVSAEWSLSHDASEPDDRGVHDLHPIGVPMIAAFTDEDGGLPVEVLRDDRGAVVAARMSFTTDVDVVSGHWTEVGSLHIFSGRCLACAPYQAREDPRLEFDVAPGRYIAEVFEHGSDIIGLRIHRGGGAAPELDGTRRG